MTSIRLPDNIESQLEQLCLLTRRSKSFYIKEAIARYLEDIADQYIALDRIAQPKRRLFSTKEMLKEIDTRK